MSHLAPLSVVVLLTCSLTARAETPVAAPAAETAPAPARPLDALKASTPSASGISIGFDDGLWGDGMTGSLRLKVPLSFIGLGSFGFHVGPIFLMHNTVDGPDPYFGGRFYVFGQSPVLANCLRLYGGFGVQVIKSLGNPAEPLSIFPYGQDGIEFFMLQRLSFYLEIGLTPLNSRYPITGVAVFGVNFYLTEAN